MHENMPKYLKVPASATNSKMIFDIFKKLNLSSVKDSDLDNNINRDKLLREFVINKDMITPKFQYLDLESQLKPKGFMDMFKASFHNRPVESDLNPTPLKKEGWNTSKHSILPTYRMVDESAISKMELDTLFFIIYYQKVSSIKRRFNPLNDCNFALE